MLIILLLNKQFMFSAVRIFLRKPDIQARLVSWMCERHLGEHEIPLEFN